MQQRRDIKRTVWLMIPLLFGLAGCSGLEPVASYSPVTDPTQLYQRLTLDHRAVNLLVTAPYDTLQLTATSWNAAGEPMTGLPVPTFKSSDTTKVWVTPEGLLQARAAATGIRVIAEVVASGNVRHADTAVINVVSFATPTLDTIADTLGVTGCNTSVICGDGPGSTPEYGQPPGGFPVPSGYSFAYSFTIYPVSPAIKEYCYDYSWYEPCYLRDSTTVYVYARTSSEPQLPEFASLSLDPVPPDSAVWGDFSQYDFALAPIIPISIKRLRARALDGDSNAITGLAIDYMSLDPTIATVDRDGYLTSRHPGQARIVARTTAYGVTRADTIVYTMTWPSVQVISIATSGRQPVSSFIPSEVRLAPYGIVLWENELGDTVDVTFEDPTHVEEVPITICENYAADPDYYGPGPHCGTGNVMVPARPDPMQGGIQWTRQARQFPVPGIYRYHSTRTGATGRIIVTADPDPTALP